MLPVPANILKRLRLEDAIHAEAKSWQSLMPVAPGWDLVEGDAQTIANWLNGQLRAGLPTVRNVVVSARKVAHGIRPIPIWGFAERITYRALVDFILRNETPLDRSAETYLKFIGAPIRYAQSLLPPTSPLQFATIGGSEIKYVVKADITAFYDYIDHGILSRELLTRTGDNDAINCLMSLLAEVQGRAFGIPQLLDSSDRLSEIYIDIAERDILRRGWPAWRFNDDFRIATRNFSAALSAIEDLAAAAREIGLTLSDGKTTTPRYITYAFENFGLGVDDEAPEELQRLQAEDAIGDYTEGIGETDPSWAVEVIARIYTPDTPADERSKNGIDLGSVRGEEFRLLRRCLGRLIRAGVPDSLPHVLKLVAYVPALTPWVVRYVVKAGSQQLGQAVLVLDHIMTNITLSDWQRLWVVHAIDELEVLKPDAPGNSSARIEWVARLRHGRHSPVVASEAAFALASVGSISYDELEYALRDQPGALIPWYLGGIRRLYERGDATAKEFMAIRGEGGLFAALLPGSST